MLLMQSLNKLGSPEQKLGALIKKHAELVSTVINNILPLKHKKWHLLTSYLIVVYENEIILYELKKKGAFEKRKLFWKHFKCMKNCILKIYKYITILFIFVSMCVPWELNPQPLRC